MRSFSIRDLTLELPESALRGGIGGALTSGRYEKTEADAILTHLRRGDRFLDLGAGLGFLCCLAAQVIGQDNVTGVEAGPETLGLARANLALNGFRKVRLIHGAVTGQESGEVEFGQRPAFWASGLKGDGDWPGNARVLRVPALPAAPLLAEVAPTVICADIEGAEMAVLTGPLPDSLRLIVAEIHPDVYGTAGTKRIFDALSAAGFAYSPEGSRGATVVWERVAA